MASAMYSKEVIGQKRFFGPKSQIFPTPCVQNFNTIFRTPGGPDFFLLLFLENYLLIPMYRTKNGPISVNTRF